MGEQELTAEELKREIARAGSELCWHAGARYTPGESIAGEELDELLDKYVVQQSAVKDAELERFRQLLRDAHHNNDRLRDEFKSAHTSGILDAAKFIYKKMHEQGVDFIIARKTAQELESLARQQPGSDVVWEVERLRRLRDCIDEQLQWPKQRAENNGDYESMVRHTAEQVKDLRATVARLEEKIADWQCATGLIGSCGDPSDVTPEHLEKHIATLERELAEYDDKVSILLRQIDGQGIELPLEKAIVFGQCVEALKRITADRGSKV